MKTERIGVVSIDALEMTCIIGCRPEERLVPGRLILDLRLDVDFSRAAETDSIEDVVDYCAVVERLTIHIQEAEFKMLERLTVSCAQLLLQEFGGISACWIKASKPDAIASARCTSAEIRISR